jgi:predicted PurR-regulated permease PerM/phosphoglycolate phosphatase-like HAD superfamily hydrolase
MGSRRWSNVTKIIVAASLAVLTIVLTVMFRVLIAPTIVAFLLAFILSYPVNWIQRSTAAARTLAVVVIYVLLVAVVVLTPILVVPRLADLIVSLQTTLQELVSQLRGITEGPILTLGPLRLSLNLLTQQAGEILGNLLVAATGDPLSLARGVTNSVITIVYVLVLTFWLLKDFHKVQRLILDQIPADYQEDARRLGIELGRTWHAFLRGQLVLAFVVGVMTWIPLLIVGMPNAGGLALLAGAMEFLPSIGPGISGAVGTTLAFFLGSNWLPVNNVTFAVVVFLIYIVIAQTENIYLVPRLVGGQVKLHPAVAFVGIVAGTLVFGLLGVLLAMPIMASVRIILAYLYRKLLDLEPFEPISGPQSGVHIPGLIAGRKIDAVAFDLDGTLAVLDWSAVKWAEQNLTWLDDVVPAATRGRAARRLMIGLEGAISFLVSRFLREPARPEWARVMPLLNRLRGYPADDAFEPLVGIDDLLARLAQRYQLILISTRPRAEIDCFLSRAGLPVGRFVLTVGREETRNLLPHSDPLLFALAQVGLEAGQLLMVSDTDSNLRSARAMEIATAGVLCGLGEERDLQDADLIVAATSDLADWL